MKKVFSLALALIFVLSVFSAIPVSANTESIDDNLVIHYDFEGADSTEAMKDKSTKGAADDDLSIYNNSTVYSGTDDSGIIVDPRNGTVKNTVIGYGLGAAWSDDVQEVFDSSTWFIRVKFEDLDDKQFIQPLHIWAGRQFILQYDTSNSCFQVNVGKTDGTTPTVRNSANANYSYDFTKSEYINIAVVVNEFNDNGTDKVNVKIYITQGLPENTDTWSNGEILDWTFEGKICETTPGNGANTKYMHVLAFSDTNSATGVTLDDMRLYNTALTLEQIATIIPNGSFDMSEIASLYGTQYNKIADNDDDATNDKYNVRFVGTVGADITNYAKVGYEIVLSGTGVQSKQFTLSSAQVFTSILGSDRSGISQEYTATALGSTGLFALTITNVPMEYDTYTIKTFVEDSEGNRTVTHTYTMERSAPWDTAAAE